MSRSSFIASGGKHSNDGHDPKWEPKVDKDPFYKTTDIFNGVFRKKIKLSAGSVNCTDLHTIYINFGEFKPGKITQILRPGSDPDRLVFLLECGHEWEGKKISKDGNPKKIGDWGMCAPCGTDTVYRGFEHEWQHIIFKTDLAAQKLFCDQYAEQMLKQLTPGGISKDELIKFIHFVVNAFDDIRVNSLWEKVYPGSALAIWSRWQQFAARMENSNSAFLPFIFAVAFNIPTNPQGEFEPMRPVIEWALKRIRYRGFNNMLKDVRVVIDRCMGAILAGLKPKPPQNQLQPPPPPSMAMPSPQTKDVQAGNTDGNQNSQKDGSNTGSEKVPSGQESTPNQETGKESESVDKENTESQTGSSDESGVENSVLGGVPSAASIAADGSRRENALSKLMQNLESLDPKEEHLPPSSEDLETANKSQALRAALNQALNSDISDANPSLREEPDGEPDADMQTQIDQLQNGIASKSDASQLTDAAKAKVTIIKVTKEGTGKLVVDLDDSEKTAIKRLRATFLRSMGRQKAKRAAAGMSVDVESVIQYLSDSQDPDVFNDRNVSRGFAYSVVSDMSGSMSGCFPHVCRAIEILKQSLDFPFVVGNFWGFRGGHSVVHSKDKGFGNGEVWMYQYDKEVDWYTGTVSHRAFPGPNGVFQVPVECGGITPMNSAVNVATGHLWRKIPASMSKRMFLLTDGSPVQSKLTGRLIPDHILRKFVAKEILQARKHGIQVNTVVIGEHAIDDDVCTQMFGQSKYWIKVKQNEVGSALVTLVLRNFNKYLRGG